ncbi:hypothetical protein [Roseisolibacter agri]|uniref:Uncharacterized protein n=1 Tax=Roseisolibacter agri TaxID=2014610 RepID=A0AA37V4V6_9BACT|nr:hypothetical protein [Roseisolibacter agri]GLC28407.1 hypothetical protein rosag_49200 [Roseisolibacter agri]
MRASTRPLFWTAAVVTALALPAGARAQQPLAPIQVSARTAEADRLDERAVAYEETGSRRKWAKAAGLREKAASLRAPEDPQAFRSLQTAAYVRHALKQPGMALSLMQRAADQALARGDVFNAASAYADVAAIAQELRDNDRARASVEKSALLTRSPLLSAPDREWLQHRLAQTTMTLPVVASAPTQP